MQVHPFVHLGDDLRGSLAVDNAVEHADAALVLAVSEMDVRRIVVAPVEADDDSKEFADFRHNVSCFVIYGDKFTKYFAHS